MHWPHTKDYQKKKQQISGRFGQIKDEKEENMCVDNKLQT